MMNNQIAIVGAGIAGLTAGYFLKKAGYHPIVFEKSGRVGGRMITDVVDGFSIDCGAQFLMDCNSILNSLITSNGLSDQYTGTSQYTGVVRDGRIRKISLDNPFSPLTSGTLGFQAWLRFLWRSIPLTQKTSNLSLNDYTAWIQFDDGDAETWCNATFGKEVADYIVDPIIDGLFFQSLKDVSRAFAASMLSIFLYRKSKNTALSAGIGSLPECLASQLDVHLNTTVTCMTFGESGARLETGAGPVTADRVILATTAPMARSLYEQPGEVERELLATPYSSTVVVAIAMEDSFHIDPGMEDIYGFMVPKPERSVITTIANNAAKIKPRHTEGHVFIVCLSGEAGKEMIGWEDEPVLAVVLKEMDKYITGVSGKVRFTKIYRWKEAMPSSPIGRSRNIFRYRGSVSNATRVFLAGDYMGFPFTEGAAETGKWAADALIKSLGAESSR